MTVHEFSVWWFDPDGNSYPYPPQEAAA